MLLSREQFVDGAQEFCDVDRLGDVRGGTVGQESFDLSFSGVGAEHDHWEFGGARIGAQGAQYAVAVDVGKVEIEEYECGLVSAGKVEPEASLHRGYEVDVAAGGEDVLDQLDVGEVVFNVENGVAVRVWGDGIGGEWV